MMPGGCFTDFESQQSYTEFHGTLRYNRKVLFITWSDGWKLKGIDSAIDSQINAINLPIDATD